jgi:hypothetical protein
MVPEARPDCLSTSLCRAAQQSERRRRRCPSVRPVSGAGEVTAVTSALSTGGRASE